MLTGYSTYLDKEEKKKLLGRAWLTAIKLLEKKRTEGHQKLVWYTKVTLKNVNYELLKAQQHIKYGWL